MEVGTLDQLLMRHLDEQYGLRAPRLGTMDQGLGQQVLRVESGGAVYVLKRYAKGDDPDAIVNRSCRAHQHAKRCGLPVAEIIPDRAGSLIATPPGERLVLYRWVEGRKHTQATFTAKAAAALGQVIGRLELAYRSLDVTGMAPDFDWPLTVDEGCRRLATLVREAAAGRVPEEDVTLGALRDRLATHRRMADSMRCMEALPAQWVHGDCNPGNFLFTDDDRVAAVLDFDNASRLPQGFDLMYALDQSFREPGPVAAASLRAYLDVARPSREAFAAYPAMHLYSDLQNIWAGDYHGPTGASGVMNYRWWARNLKRMTDFFGRAYDAWVSAATGGT